MCDKVNLALAARELDGLMDQSGKLIDRFAEGRVGHIDALIAMLVKELRHGFHRPEAAPQPV